jgi:uncharacterized membrane protein YcaP (DUF421 family)
MEDLLIRIFGEGRDLDAAQMAARAFVMFFIAIVLVRLSGMRSFGSKTSFDIIVVIMLGAILSRAVVGVSPFLPTVAAAITICITHRVLAMLSSRIHFLSDLLKGTNYIIYKDGKLNKKNMTKCDLSMGDLEEGIRLAGNVSSLEEVKEVRMERSGQISVVK